MPRVINIQPTPQVLLALTNTPLRPLDALCELIDNAIDSFRTAKLQGRPIEHPWINITVPGVADIDRGLGAIIVADNGIGLDEDAMEKAMTAGFSSQNQFDSLGLFGMGFNIATGKLGMKTKVLSARREDAEAIEAVLSLPDLVKIGNFDLEPTSVEKPTDFESGTIVTIDGWWPPGDKNHGFARKLAEISKAKLREQIGRRYATILRRSDEGRINIQVNGEPVRDFNHCVWSEQRFVERQNHGRIPAKITFDEILHTQRLCTIDRTELSPEATKCDMCGGTEFRSISERVHGWVGIQRFDDADNFGIDVIRNGRAILVAEQDAFFYFVDEYNNKSKEYNLDSQYGRIVGEVHLDHVPVDFTKQDFQRVSESWMRAISFLRGQSLLTSKWPEGYKNTSPVGMLFSGYRRVRKFGKEDMYMGRWDEAQGKTVRIERSIEQEYYEKFKQRIDGYFDDANWWKLVEEATREPIKGLTPCPVCEFQNGDDDEECADCGQLLKSKECVSCKELIALSAVTCGICGASQVPTVDQPWRCEVCLTTNHVEEDNCSTCHRIRGTENPMSYNSLLARGTQRQDLSFESKMFQFTGAQVSSPVSLECFEVSPDSLVRTWGGEPLPVWVEKPSIGTIKVFIDPTHSIFSRVELPVEMLLATEVAAYLKALQQDLNTKPVSELSASVLDEIWGETLGFDVEKQMQQLNSMFEDICDLLIDLPEAAEFYKELTPTEQAELTSRVIAVDKLRELSDFASNGRFLTYVSPRTLCRFYQMSGQSWFGLVFDDELPSGDFDASVIEIERERKIKKYQRALEECSDFLSPGNKSTADLNRMRAAFEFLQEKLV